MQEKISLKDFKDMKTRYEAFIEKNNREPAWIATPQGGRVNLTTFKDMLARYIEFKDSNGREPKVIYVKAQKQEDKVSLEAFKDMLRRYNAFKEKNGRDPAWVQTPDGSRVQIKDFLDMKRRYNEFMAREGREPRYIEINPVLRPKLNGVWTKKVMVVLGDFKDATGLYKLVAGKCKYKYYYNDQYRSEDALKRMTTVGINCTDACQLFEKVFLEMGYEARIEHCKVKCRDGEWYGHYLLNLRGYEFRDWVVWDYVSATQTGRPLGRPCCVDGFKHLGYGVIGGVYG